LNGTGGLTKSGDGTLILADSSNSYSGTTTVTAGTLQNALGFVDNTDYIVNGGILDVNGHDLTMSSLSGTGGSVTLGSATLTVNQSGDTSYNGDISGAGSLTKGGSGTLTLGATNSYTSGTTVSGGTLQSGVAGALVDNTDYTVNGGTLDLNNFDLSMSSLSGSGGDIALGSAALTVDQSSITSYAGSISGTGGFSKNGSGTLTLSGSNTYSGGTELVGGTLSISSDSNLGNSGDTLTLNGGTLQTTASFATARSTTINSGNGTFDTSGGTTLTHSGSISGSGALEKTGTGTLALTGTNSYSGGTLISAGTLLGNADSLQGSITNNANVVFGQATDGTYAGDMDGSGSLSKTGTGTLYLTGNNTYTGPSTIDNGTLSVNGATTSATTVNAGGTLQGSGTVGSVTLNGGTVAPGNSIGTLNVSGDVDYSGGGTYQVEVDDAGNSDKIIATGTATLTGSSVEVIASNGSYGYSSNYTILTAGGINGTFDSVSSNLAFLDPSLSYDSNNAYLTLTRNDVSFGDVGETKNQRAVSNSLSAIASSPASGGDMQTLLNAVTTLTTRGAQQAYDSLSGVQHAGIQTLLLSANDRFSHLLSVRSNSLAAHPGRISSQAAFIPVRLAYNGDLSGLQLASNGTDTGLVKTQGSGFWLTPRGGTGSIEDTANASGLDYTWYGLYGGADKWLDNHRLVGFAFGASHADADPVAGDSTINSVELAAYGRWQDEQRYLDASLNAGQQRTDTSRRVTVGPLSRTASADYDSQSLGLAVEAGQTIFEQGDQRMTPFIGLHYARLRRDGFAESGAGSANLVVDRETQESLQGRLGIRAAQHSKTESGRTLDWDVSLAWARELKDTASTLTAGLDGASSATFNIDGPELERNRVQLGIGLTTDISQTTTLRIGYDGELASSHQSHIANATLSMTW
ncbi:MAG: autotransporter domain-containing protein, partial [Candidatus Thiodiazotropha sp.]